MNKIRLTSKYLETKDIEYPEIAPIDRGVDRPFWSVMIPIYNRIDYLGKTLKSVLEQDPGVAQMHIEVVDNCSENQNIKKMVQDIGKGRVEFYQQPENVGMINNWNTCLQRSRGHWVHVLHDDDNVLPGFYSQLRSAIEQDSTIGLAFCREVFIDEHGHQKGFSPIERETPGIISDIVERLAVRCMQFVSIVTRRTVYEKLGGFCLEAGSNADWEMWKRIVVQYPVWYEPQPLACYLLHSGSASSQLIKSGQNIRDIRKTIAISEHYLISRMCWPESTVLELSSKSLESYAIYAINQAWQLSLRNNDTATAFLQIKGAIKCSKSIKTLKSVIDFIVWFTARWLWKKSGIKGLLRHQ